MATTLWPIDYNPDPSATFDFSNCTDGSGLSIFGGNDPEQELYNALSEMRQGGNNIMNVQAFFGDIKALQTLQTNGKLSPTQISDIEAALNGIKGADGSSIGTFMADTYAVWAFFNAAGPDLPNKIANTIANITARISELTGDQSIGGDLKTELTRLTDPSALKTLLVPSYWQTEPTSGIDGYGFINPQTNTWVDCSSADNTTANNDLDAYLSGAVYNWISHSNMKGQNQALKMGMFNEEANNPLINQYGVFALVVILLMTLSIGDGESNQSGLSENSKAQAKWSQDLATINSGFTPDYFSGPQGDQNTKSWFEALQDLQTQIDTNGTASDVAESADPLIKSIFDTQDGTSSTTPQTLRDNFLACEKAYNVPGHPGISGNPKDFDGLRVIMNKFATNPSAPVTNPDGSSAGPDDIASNLASIGKTTTSSSQIISTKLNAASTFEQQAQNTLAQDLTALKKAIDAIISAMAQA